MTEIKERPKLIDGYDFVDVTKDWVFKTVLTDSQLREYLADLISGITELNKDYLLNNMEVVSNELGKDQKDSKFSKVDILVSVEKNQINIEANRKYSEELIAKNNSYAHKLRGSMAKVGGKYLDSGQLIQINFDNYKRFKKDKRLIGVCRVLNDVSYEVEDDKYIVYHVNLPKIFKMCYTEDIKDRLMRELALLMVRTEEEAKKIAGDDKVMEMVTKKIRTLSGDEAFVVAYNAKELEDNIHEEELGNAKKEGIEQGKKEGIEQRNRELAKKMLEKDIDKETIIEVTGLSKEELNELNKI